MTVYRAVCLVHDRELATGTLHEVGTAEFNHHMATGGECRSMREPVDQADIDKINSAIEDLKKALDGQDIEEIKAKMEALNQASHKISEMLYKQAQEGMGGAEQAQAGAAGGPEAAAGATAEAGGEEDEDIVDADFEVEDENK